LLTSSGCAGGKAQATQSFWYHEHRDKRSPYIVEPLQSLSCIMNARLMERSYPRVYEGLHAACVKVVSLDCYALVGGNKTFRTVGVCIPRK